MNLPGSLSKKTEERKFLARKLAWGNEIFEKGTPVYVQKIVTRR